MVAISRRMTGAPNRPMVAETFEARLVRAHLVTPRVRLLQFSRVDGAPFAFQSGQWVSLTLPTPDEKGRPVRRSYSVASVPSGGPAFELVVTRVDDGVGSTWLHGLAPGATVEAKGPQGTFTRPPGLEVPSLLVATGTGLAPFRGMLHEALASGAKAPVQLLFGARTPADLLFHDELLALARAHPRFTYTPTLSRPGEGWAGAQGYVQTHVVQAWAGLQSHGAPEAWVCGVKKMLTSVREVLKGELGVERARVHAESYD
jgi:ferredoxin-NADP reductase